MLKCNQCGKQMKNAFAMKIHVGRMHKKGNAPKADRIAKPVAPTGLDVQSLGVDEMIALKQQVDGRLAEVARQLRLAGVMDGKPGRKPGKPTNNPDQLMVGKKVVVPVAQQAAAPAAKRRKKRGVFKVTGEQLILDLLARHQSGRGVGGLAGGKTLTTAEISKAWKAEGRGGKAGNALTRLVKAKKLKRTPTKGGQGSNYVLA